MTGVDGATLLSDSLRILPELLLMGFAFLILVLAAVMPREDRRWIAWVSLAGTIMIVPIFSLNL